MNSEVVCPTGQQRKEYGIGSLSDSGVGTTTGTEDARCLVKLGRRELTMSTLHRRGPLANFGIRLT